MAHFGCAALPGLLANLATAPVTVYEALAMCESPRVAETFAQALVRSKKYRATAQKWFKSFPQAAAVGLIPAALRGKEKEGPQDREQAAIRPVGLRGSVARAALVVRAASAARRARPAPIPGTIPSRPTTRRESG